MAGSITIERPAIHARPTHQAAEEKSPMSAKQNVNIRRKISALPEAFPYPRTKSLYPRT